MNDLLTPFTLRSDNLRRCTDNQLPRRLSREWRFIIIAVSGAHVKIVVVRRMLAEMQVTSFPVQHRHLLECHFARSRLIQDICWLSSYGLVVLCLRQNHKEFTQRAEGIVRLNIRVSFVAPRS